MSTYRSPPAPRTPIIVATNHSLVGVIIGLIVLGSLSHFILTHEQSYGSNWPGYASFLVGLALAAVMLRARTRFIIDEDAKLLTVESRWLFVRSQAFPVKDIAAAEVHAERSDGNTLHGIRLLFKDGTAKDVTSSSNFGNREKIRVVEAVNAALREVEPGDAQ